MARWQGWYLAKDPTREPWPAPNRNGLAPGQVLPSGVGRAIDPVQAYNRDSPLLEKHSNLVFVDLFLSFLQNNGPKHTSRLTEWSFCNREHTVLAVGKFPVSHGIPQIPTGDIMSRQFCGNHPCLKISVIIPGRQPCPMVITEMFRNGPYYHGTQCVPREFVGYRETRETFPPPILYIQSWQTCCKDSMISLFMDYSPPSLGSKADWSPSLLYKKDSEHQQCKLSPKYQVRAHTSIFTDKHQLFSVLALLSLPLLQFIHS